MGHERGRPLLSDAASSSVPLPPQSFTVFFSIVSRFSMSLSRCFSLFFYLFVYLFSFFLRKIEVKKVSFAVILRDKDKY